MDNESKDLIEKLENKCDNLFSDLDEELEETTEEDNMIYLTDEHGKKVPFEFLDLVSYQGNEYVVLYPADDSKETGEVVILKVGDSENDDEESYDSVDDEETLMAVFKIFKDKFKDEFNFVDE